MAAVMTTPQISLGRVTLVDALASPYAYAHRVPCCIHSLLVGRGIVIGGIRVGQVRSNAEVCSVPPSFGDKGSARAVVVPVAVLLASRDHTPCWRWVDPSDLLHDSAWGCLTAQDDFGPTPGPSASVGWPNSIGNLTIRDPDTEDYGPEFTSPISGEKYTLVVQALLYLHTQPT